MVRKMIIAVESHRYAGDSDFDYDGSWVVSVYG
jgi:hypothetical protein